MTMLRILLLVLLAVPAGALADRRELYTQLSLGPSVLFLSDPNGTSSTATQPALGVELATFYGLTNTLHVGASLRFVGTRNARYQGISVLQPDGSLPVGSLYVDTWSLGAAALAAYRYDTGFDLAPVARLELGLAHSSYQRRQLIPETRTYALDLPSDSDFAITARASVALEYRIRSNWVVSGGLGMRRAFGSAARWSLDIPITFGLIW